MAHAHRKLRQGQGAARAELFGKGAQAAEGWAGTLRGFRGGGYAHEPANVQLGQGAKVAPYRQQRFRGEAVLAFLAIHVDLQQNGGGDAQLARDARNALCKAQAVHRLQQGEARFQRLAHLVALQRANEVPLAVRGHGGFLAHGLLQAVFAEEALPVCIGLHDVLHGEGFAHRQQGGAACGAPGALFRRADVGANFL